MARGSKISDEVKERAFALLAVNDNVQAVADELGLPRSTVKTWKKKWEQEEKDAPVDETITLNAPLTPPVDEKPKAIKFAELRQKKKEQFVDRAWGMLERTQNLLERRIKRAEAHERDIDKLVDEVKKLPGLNQTERNALFTKLSEIKLESTKSLAVLLGTLYDKQALAAKEPTMNVGGSVTHRWEEL